MHGVMWQCDKPNLLQDL